MAGRWMQIEDLYDFAANVTERNPQMRVTVEPESANGPLALRWQMVATATGEVTGAGAVPMRLRESRDRFHDRFWADALGTTASPVRAATYETDIILFRSERFRSLLLSTLARVEYALSRHKRPYVAFSGGKDSIAASALITRMRPGVTLNWSDDELEYPEVVEYMGKLRAESGEQLQVTLGWARHANWFDPWRDEPHWRDPLDGAVAIERPADDWMAEIGYDLSITGVRAEESRKRRDWLISTHMSAGPAGYYRVSTGTGTRFCPIWDWTADDVWALIAGWQLPYPATYDTLTALDVPRKQQRVGPLPLARREHLEEGWPEMYDKLVRRYGDKWQ